MFGNLLLGGWGGQPPGWQWGHSMGGCGAGDRGDGAGFGCRGQAAAERAAAVGLSVAEEVVVVGKCVITLVFSEIVFESWEGALISRAFCYLYLIICISDTGPAKNYEGEKN